MEEKVIEQAFEISPTNVYGFVVGTLCVALIVVSAALWKFIGKYIEMNLMMINTLSDVKNMFVEVKQAADNHDDNWEKRLELFSRLLDTKLELIQRLVNK